MSKDTSNKSTSLEKVPTEVTPAPVDSPLEADELNFNGSHIASCNRYGTSLKITLATGAAFSPKFSDVDSCRSVMRQVQFAINTGTVIHIAASKA